MTKLLKIDYTPAETVSEASRMLAGMTIYLPSNTLKRQAESLASFQKEAKKPAKKSKKGGRA